MTDPLGLVGTDQFRDINRLNAGVVRVGKGFLKLNHNPRVIQEKGMKMFTEILLILEIIISEILVPMQCGHEDNGMDSGGEIKIGGDHDGTRRTGGGEVRRWNKGGLGRTDLVEIHRVERIRDVSFKFLITL